MSIWAVLLRVLLVPASATDEFAKYPAGPALTTRPATLRVDTAHARKFRTVLRREAAAGANFNGQYRIAKWGCGTNCIEWAVINLRTGATWFAAQPATSCFASDAPIGKPVPDWFDSRVNSRLFYLRGCSAQSERSQVRPSIRLRVEECSPCSPQSRESRIAGVQPNSLERTSARRSGSLVCIGCASEPKPLSSIKVIVKGGSLLC
jgi:hypothetical protein